MVGEDGFGIRCGSDASQNGLHQFKRVERRIEASAILESLMFVLVVAPGHQEIRHLSARRHERRRLLRRSCASTSLRSLETIHALVSSDDMCERALA